MNKELSPLEAINDLRYAGLIKDDVVCFTKKAFEKRLDIIETALKEETQYKDKYCKVIAKLIVSKVLNKKKLKALEIIKKYLFIDFNDKSKAILFKKYKEQECDYTIILCNTQEEYDLMKEVLV